MLPPMLADMTRQPEVLRRLLSAPERFLAAGKACRPDPGGTLYVIGCGDGLFAAQSASEFATLLGLPWMPIPALEMLVRRPGRLGKADRLIAVSMSGNVDRTVQAAEAVAWEGAGVLSLVNGNGGRLAGVVDATVVSLDIPDLARFLCGTTTYSATLAALMLLACGAAGRADFLDRIAPAIDAQTAAMQATLPEFPVPTGIRVLSAGANAGTAAYGAAKLVELTRLPAWGADLEEFAHSQFWAMPDTDLVVLVANDRSLVDYARDTADALRQMNVATLAIDCDDAQVFARHRISVIGVPGPVVPLVACVPLQRLAYSLALATGLDPDTRLHLKDDAARFRTSRLLTRRSLVGTGA